MSFWDTLKPAARPPVATAVELLAENRGVQIRWDDGQLSTLSARTLRQQCPCAECVDEWTRERKLDPASVPETMKILEMHPVGNYALSFVFSDAHRTGIFNWGMLRQTVDG